MAFSTRLCFGSRLTRVFFHACVAAGLAVSVSARVSSVLADDKPANTGTAAVSTAGATADEKDFVSLFDGKSLKGWTGATESHEVVNGVIACRPGTSGNLLTDNEYSDFEFRFEFKLSPGANNGLGIRCPNQAKGNLHLAGIELQILDDTHEKYATIKPYQFHGSVYGIQPAKRGALKPVGEWNKEEVVAIGRRVTVIVNGQTIVDANLDEASANGTLDGQAHPGLKRTSGHIGFLGHGDQVEFRNIRIKNLAPKGK